jgi:hypothetical protein
MTWGSVPSTGEPKGERRERRERRERWERQTVLLGLTASPRFQYENVLQEYAREGINSVDSKLPAAPFDPGLELRGPTLRDGFRIRE